MDNYKPPNFLRLTGIGKDDFESIEDLADARLLATAEEGCVSPGHVDERAIPPDRIPRVFTGLEDWPARTNLRCWQCHFTFDDVPKFWSPYAREGEDGRVEFGVKGNFCTFNCAELYLSTHLAGREDALWRARDLLCLAYFMFTGRRVNRIRPAYSVTELQTYGGDWTVEVFWGKMRELDPFAGLKDHTPGSVIPERDRAAPVPPAGRPATAAALLRSGPTAMPQKITASDRNFWALCGADSVEVPFTAGSVSPASVPDLDKLLENLNLGSSPDDASPDRAANGDVSADPLADPLTDLLADDADPLAADADPLADMLAEDADPLTEDMDPLTDLLAANPLTKDTDPLTDLLAANPLTEGTDPLTDLLAANPLTEDTDPLTADVDPPTDLLAEDADPLTADVDPPTDLLAEDADLLEDMLAAAGGPGEDLLADVLAEIGIS